MFFFFHHRFVFLRPEIIIVGSFCHTSDAYDALYGLQWYIHALRMNHLHIWVRLSVLFNRFCVEGFCRFWSLLWTKACFHLAHIGKFGIEGIYWTGICEGSSPHIVVNVGYLFSFQDLEQNRDGGRAWDDVYSKMMLIIIKYSKLVY